MSGFMLVQCACGAEYSTTPELARHIESVWAHYPSRVATLEAELAAAKAKVVACEERIAKLEGDVAAWQDHAHQAARRAEAAEAKTTSERAAIVAWLRAEADTVAGVTVSMVDVSTIWRDLADAIEAGAHLDTEKKR